MKLKDGLVMGSVAGKTVVIPVGEGMDLNTMITLNETGKLLWERLEKGAEPEELVAALLAEYAVDAQTAAEHVALFVEKLETQGFLA